MHDSAQHPPTSPTVAPAATAAPLGQGRGPGNYAIRVYANCDHVLIAWLSPAKIPDCRGFAINRQRNGQPPEVLDTWLGFDATPLAQAAQTEPSTTWPVQKCLWSDFLVRQGDRVSYRVVPMIGPDHTHLQAHEELASGWTEIVAVVAGPDGEGGSPCLAYFNRGILAAQWVTRLVAQEGHAAAPATEIRTAIDTPHDPLRDRLAGALRGALLDLLTSAKTGGQQVYAALFELDDPELLPLLASFAADAHVVLANGSPKPGERDENAAARAQLKGAGCDEVTPLW